MLYLSLTIGRNLRIGRASHSILWSCLYLPVQLCCHNDQSYSLDFLHKVPPLAEVLYQVNYTWTHNSQ